MLVMLFIEATEITSIITLRKKFKKILLLKLFQAECNLLFILNMIQV